MPPSVGTGITVGSDIVAISRIERLLDEYPDKFRNFAYSDTERRYCDEQRYPPQHYAARWAVKEAYIKAVGDPGTNPDLSTIQVVRRPNPRLSLSDDGLELLSREAATRGTSAEATSIAVSLSHEKVLDLAQGVVVVQF